MCLLLNTFFYLCLLRINLFASKYFVFDPVDVLVFTQATSSVFVANCVADVALPIAATPPSAYSLTSSALLLPSRTAPVPRRSVLHITAFLLQVCRPSSCDLPVVAAAYLPPQSTLCSDSPGHLGV